MSPLEQFLTGPALLIAGVFVAGVVCWWWNLRVLRRDIAHSDALRRARGPVPVIHVIGDQGRRGRHRSRPKPSAAQVARRRAAKAARRRRRLSRDLHTPPRGAR